MADKKHKKVLGSLQPDIEDILSWNDLPANAFEPASTQIGRASCRERV